MSTKHRIILWLFTHLVVRFMRKDVFLTHEVFGRVTNLFLESQGWKLEMDPQLGLRWNKLGLHLFTINALEQCARQRQLEERFSLLPPEALRPLSQVLVLPGLPRRK
jgi:hypothetical protein